MRQILAVLSSCRSAIENLVGEKSPPASEQGNATLSRGFQFVKCLKVSGTFIVLVSFSIFFMPTACDRVSQNKTWLYNFDYFNNQTFNNQM